MSVTLGIRKFMQRKAFMQDIANTAAAKPQRTSEAPWARKSVMAHATKAATCSRFIQKQRRQPFGRPGDVQLRGAREHLAKDALHHLHPKTSGNSPRTFLLEAQNDLQPGERR